MAAIDPARPHAPGPPGRRCPDCPEGPAAAVHTTLPRQARVTSWAEVKDRAHRAGGGTVLGAIG